MCIRDRPFADSYVTDKQQYCLPSLLSRSTPKKYYWAKLKMVAFSAAFVIFIPFFIHFILSLIAFPDVYKRQQEEVS